MLELLNPSLPVMSMQCCSHYPYCSHQSRQPSTQSLHSVGLGVTVGTSWECSMSPPYEAQFSYARQPQDIHYSEDAATTTVNPRAMPTTSGLPILGHRPNWSTSEASSHDYGADHWSMGRESSQHLNIEGHHYGNGYDYVSNHGRYPSYGYREYSPSRTADMSTISVSSQSSPAAIHAGYDMMMIKSEDGHGYLPSQPMIPEGVESIERQMSGPYSPGSSGYMSESRGKSSRSRKSKAQEMIHCQICLKAFDRKSNYKSHCEIHEKDRQRIKCKIQGCDKTFGRPAEMTRHVNSAHKQKSFNCDACGKDFTRNDILIRHRNDACPILNNTGPGLKKRRGRSHS